MSHSIIPFGGWQRNLQLKNDTVELVITLDVGPRVLSYKRFGGVNVLKNYEDQMGGTAENEWMIRGGHRIWLSPEDEVMTYTLDNEPVEHRVNPDGSVTIINPAAAPWRIRKELTLKLDPCGSGVTVHHLATNIEGPPLEVATWALTVMAPGGVELIPQPPLGEHPRDLLPNRLMVIWPYSDFADPRWKLGRKFFTLRQTPGGTPAKIGLAHREKWIGYVLGKELFVKTFSFEPGMPYPDHGCNFETFTDHTMLEVESLSPLKRLENGESVSHTERWQLFETDGAPPVEDEEALEAWVAKYMGS